MNKKYLFTFTAGHTGSTYLGDLLRLNLGDKADVIQELITTETWGILTPEISDFHEFNQHGNTSKIKKFWHRKFSFAKESIKDFYMETSHVNSKAGLIENLWQLRGDVHMVHLTRDYMKIMQSFHSRFDFMQVGNVWMWYLDHSYNRNLVSPNDFIKKFEEKMDEPGSLALRLWYLAEMEMRARFYKKYYNGHGIYWHTIDIEDLNDKKKVQKFFKDLGFKKTLKEIKLPENTNKSEYPLVLHDHVKETISSIWDEFQEEVKTLNEKSSFRGTDKEWADTVRDSAKSDGTETVPKY